jgi:hypothetical protein
VQPADTKATEVKQALSRDDVLGVVNAQLKAVGQCLQQALNKGEITAATYTMVVNWRIEPAGSVSTVTVVGPANLTSNSVAPCVSRLILKWKFPASQRAIEIKNFALGPIAVP